MLGLRKKSVMDRINTEQYTVTVPMPPKDDLRSFGADFNLILAVREEGPKRIAAIADEMQELETRRATLQKESDQLTRLVNALI